MKLLPVILVFAALLFTQCRSTRNSTGGGNFAEATIVKEGFIDCFEKDLKGNGQPVWCEASAVLYDGKKVWIASDKDMPDVRSSVFYLAVQNNAIDTTQPPGYLTYNVLKNATKYEDFAQTPDGKYVFLTTGFDRTKPNSHDWDKFNVLLCWPGHSEGKYQVISTNGTDSTSVSLRPKIAQALTSATFPQGAPYFKVEGLAVTKKKLYWGIREEGKQFDTFSYKIKILTVPYHINRGNVQLTGSFEVLADINIDSIKPGPETIAISSIEYDTYNKRFLILTSYEIGGKLGGYLWTATEKELKHNRMNLVKDAGGNPLHFHNKSEDVTIINKKRVLIIHDDDREMLNVNGKTRQPYQAAYSIVDFK